MKAASEGSRVGGAKGTRSRIHPFRFSCVIILQRDDVSPRFIPVVPPPLVPLLSDEHFPCSKAESSNKRRAAYRSLNKEPSHSRPFPDAFR